MFRPTIRSRSGNCGWARVSSCTVCSSVHVCLCFFSCSTSLSFEAKLSTTLLRVRSAQTAATWAFWSRYVLWVLWKLGSMRVLRLLKVFSVSLLFFFWAFYLIFLLRFSSVGAGHKGASGAHFSSPTRRAVGVEVGAKSWWWKNFGTSATSTTTTVVTTTTAVVTTRWRTTAWAEFEFWEFQ